MEKLTEENISMGLVVFLVASATALNGLLSGLNVDTALVKLPTRRRIGVVVYATFARGNDLGNGLVVYPLLGIGAVLLTVLSTAIAFISHARGEVPLLLFLATLLSVLHIFATTRAAPIMLSLKNAPDDEASLSAKLDRFTRWHIVRAAFQVVTFFILLWAMVIV
jgi:hypothetical protein